MQRHAGGNLTFGKPITVEGKLSQVDRHNFVALRIYYRTFIARITRQVMCY